MMNVAGNRRQRGRIALRLRRARDRGAIGANAARGADAFQPVQQRRPGKPARRVQPPRGIAQARFHIAPHHRPPMPGEFEQAGGVLNETALPRTQRRRRRHRRTEPGEG